MNNTANDSALSAAGRFGRLSYLGWNGLLVLVVMLIGIGFAIAIPGFSPNLEQGLPIGVILLLVVIYIAMIYFSFVFTIRRLHDRNHSGWLSLLMLVPLANLILFLYLIFARGDAQENQFGLPRSTKLWEKILGWLYVLIFPIGILAAISIPSYQGYIQQAEQTQFEIQQQAK